VTRATKKVEDLDIKATSTIARMNNKLFYALGIVRRFLAETGLQCTISIAIKLGIFGVRMAVTVKGEEKAEEIKQIETEIAKAEEAVNADESAEPQQVSDEQDSDATDKSLMKRILEGGVERLITSLKNATTKCKQLGISGEVAVMAMIEAYNCGIEIELAAGVE